MDNTKPPDEMIGERKETFRISAEVAERAAREVARPGTGEGFVEYLINYTQRSDLRIEIEGAAPSGELTVAESAEGAEVVAVAEDTDEDDK
jgi:hypothetical protein